MLKAGFVILTILANFPSAPISAQTLISPEDFKAYAQGKTLYFARNGRPYGAEQYLPNQESIWQYADGTCAKGAWFARQEMICFVYEGDDQEQCWRFLRSGQNYVARADGNTPENDLTVIARNERALQCKAPDLGV